LTTFFVDTSALGRRYLTEIGTAWVRSWIEPSVGHIIVVSELTLVEMFSALARRQRERSIAPADAAAAQANVLLHFEKQYLPVPLDTLVLSQARGLVGRYVLRSLDAIQLACALQAMAILSEPMLFISADNNLLTVAAGEGFTTDNPLAHP